MHKLRKVLSLQRLPTTAAPLGLAQLAPTTHVIATQDALSAQR